MNYNNNEKSRGAEGLPSALLVHPPTKVISHYAYAPQARRGKRMGWGWEGVHMGVCVHKCESSPASKC